MFVPKREVKWGLAALAGLALGCASSSQSKRPPTAEEQRMSARAEELEAKNRELRVQLQQKEAGIETAFRQATQAEVSAGMVNLGCAGVMPAQAPAPGMPRSGAVHMQAGLARRAFQMTSAFSGSRNMRGWLVSQGNCRVVPR